MSSSVQHIVIGPEDAGQRLDNFLLRVLKKAPKSLIYRIIRKGEVRVNKGRAKPDRKLASGDTVRVPPVSLPESGAPAVPSDGLTERLQDAILYEDRDLLVVNKPSGLAVHGGSGIHLGLVEALRHIFPNEQLELVHRLDRDTSGCIMVAKRRSTLRELHALLREEGGVDKQYLALVQGRWPGRRGSVDVPLRKNELKSGERVVRVDATGKPSKTLFSVENGFAEATLVRAKPITGRTHQIRVHALHAKHPLAGDDKYGDKDFNQRMRDVGIKRLFLHACYIQTQLPGGKRIEVSAPLPDDLRAALDTLGSIS